MEEIALTKMRRIFSKRLEELKNSELIQWVVTRPIQFFFVVLIAIGVELAFRIQPTIGLEDPEAQVILQTLQLIALILPAFAILLQAMFRFSESTAIIVAGKGPEIRHGAALIVGFGSLLMYIVVIILGRSLDLPLSLDIAIILMAIIIAGFALLPVYLASLTWTEGYRTLAPVLENFHLDARINADEEDQEEIIEYLIDRYDAEEMINLEENSISDKQTQINDFN